MTETRLETAHFVWHGSVPEEGGQASDTRGDDEIGTFVKSHCLSLQITAIARDVGSEW